MTESNVLKIIIAGDGGVGKTTLLHRYVEGKFIPNTKMTIGVEFLIKEFTLGDTDIMLQIWDFGGQGQFRHLHPRYALGALGVLIMFDLTRLRTLDNIDEWIDICLKHNEPSIPMILLGGKADLQEGVIVDDDVALEVKDKFNFVEYFKVSSLDGHNVDHSFEFLTKEILKRDLL